MYECRIVKKDLIIIKEERKSKPILASAHEPMISFVRRAKY